MERSFGPAVRQALVLGAIERKSVMPEVGLEPTLAEANTALNRARLPIPPLRHRAKWPSYQQRPRPSKVLAGARGRANFMLTVDERETGW